MYQALTGGIRVRVVPQYLEEHSDPEDHRFIWSYTVEIVNEGEGHVQLINRHWRITDAHGRIEEVRGAGVVGEQPVLGAGDSFSYTSICHLKTPSGLMAGTYDMKDAAGQHFLVTIPMFSLDSPQQTQVLN